MSDVSHPILAAAVNAAHQTLDRLMAGEMNYRDGMAIGLNAAVMVKGVDVDYRLRLADRRSPAIAAE